MKRKYMKERFDLRMKKRKGIIGDEDALITIDVTESCKEEIEMTNSCKEEIELNFCNKITFEMMLQKLGQHKACENVVSSPMSINLLLNMIVFGLKEGSEGQIDLMRALDMGSVGETNAVSSKLMRLMSHIDSNNNSASSQGPVLSVANGVWTDIKFPIKPRFLNIATRIYQAHTGSYDFVNKVGNAVNALNSWVETQTKGLIKNIVSPDSFRPHIMLILANALYFKGKWKIAFRKHMTRDMDFYVQPANKPVKVKFMNSNDLYCYGEFDDFQIVKLPYQSGGDETKKLSMYVFLPRRVTGLEKLLESFNSDPSLVHAKCKEIRERKVNVSIPKFKFSCGFKPSEIMEKMGMGLRELGELTNLVHTLEEKKVVGYEVMQKSYIEVNEEGTRTVAVSCGRFRAVGALGPVLKPASFVADHPFFFMIKDEISSATLFTGIICDPRQS